MALTTSQKIIIGQISQYLAGNYIEGHGLNGQGIDLRLPRKLYLIRKNVQWLYNLSPNDSTLISTSNLLYALCGQFGLWAQDSIVSGGSVVPIVPGVLPEPYDWQVDNTTSSTQPLKAGDSSVTLTDFIGYNVEFSRGGVTQNTTNLGDGSSYFQWNRNTGFFQIFPAAQFGDLLRIVPSR